MLEIILQFMLGLLCANIGEWCLHKYVLHGWGKVKGSFWSSHWSIHHRACRQNKNFDKDYLRRWSRNAATSEAKGLLLVALLFSPIGLISIPWVLAVWSYIVMYYVLHRKGHVDVEWGKKWMPVHFDHHLGRNQDCNWNIFFPFADHLFGTRVKYDYDSNGRAKKRRKRGKPTI